MFIKVDFPDPLAPMMAMNSSECTVSDTPQSAGTFIAPVSYIFSILSSAIKIPTSILLRAAIRGRSNLDFSF